MSTSTRFLFDNFISRSVLANDQVSSEQAAFPVDNAYNSTRRSKVWRSSGYWLITSSNNGIVFKESSMGSNLTASIAVGEYSSTTSFLTAIKTALEDVGANTYTVTQTSLLKIQIASSGGYFDLLWTNVGSTAADILGFDDSSDLTGATTYVADALKINAPYEWILWDMGLPSKPNAFAFTGPRNDPIKLSPSCIVRLKGNETNPSDWSSPTFSSVLEFDDEVIARIDDTAFNSDGLRFWRLEIEDQSPNGFIEVGTFFLGRYFQPSKCAKFPFQSTFIDNSIRQESEGKQSFDDIFPKSQEYRLQFEGLNKDDIESFTNWFSVIGTSKPFFISMDGSEAFSNMYQRFLKYVKFTTEPSYTLDRPNRFSMGVSVREEL